MRRRDFIKGIVGTITACPLATHAQPPGTGRRVGVLMPYAESDPFGRSLVAAFRASLGKLEWVEGRNLQIDLRWAAGNVEKDAHVRKRAYRSATRCNPRSEHASNRRVGQPDEDNSNCVCACI